MQLNGKWLDGSRFRGFSPFGDRPMAGVTLKKIVHNLAVKNSTQPYNYMGDLTNCT
jgi:hypothetical protein